MAALAFSPGPLVLLAFLMAVTLIIALCHTLGWVVSLVTTSINISVIPSTNLSHFCRIAICILATAACVQGVCSTLVFLLASPLLPVNKWHVPYQRLCVKNGGCVCVCVTVASKEEKRV